MNGTIRFDSASALAEFLRAFCPHTALFNARQCADGSFILEFTGGY